MRSLTSAEVAARLSVSPSTVKRWADEGLIESLRTAGGHRRFTAASVVRFRAAHGDRLAAAGEERDVERTRDWLALLGEYSDDSAACTLALAVLRGGLLDLLATGDRGRVSGAVNRQLGAIRASA